MNVNTEELTADDAFEHLFQMSVTVGKLHVGPYLGARIAQPHGMDVAGVDKGVGLAVQHTEVPPRAKKASNLWPES